MQQFQPGKLNDTLSQRGMYSYIPIYWHHIMDLGEHLNSLPLKDADVILNY